MIETTKSAEDKTSRWFDLPIDYELFRDLLGVEADSKDYQITDMKLPFAGDSVRTTSVRRLNRLYFAYTDLSPEVQQAYKDLMNDINVVIQSYNYGGGYADYVAKNGKKHSFNLAENFAKNKSGGTKVTYTNPIAVSKNGGWRYNYGNMFYVELVNQYLNIKQFSNETVQAVMNEALKYQGWKYVYGGSNPNTSFDCSGLTQWCYGKAGISLPRTAQAQYDTTQHIPLSQAQAGDLVFFHSTYNTSDYVTHVGIYVGNHQMYHAGNPIGYTDLTSAYWQQHIICAGRIKQ